jgi:hypothetical protein
MVCPAATFPKAASSSPTVLTVIVWAAARSEVTPMESTETSKQSIAWRMDGSRLGAASMQRLTTTAPHLISPQLRYRMPMSEDLSSFDVDARQRMQYVADQTLGKRIVPGGLFYPLVAAIVGVSSDYGSDFPHVVYPIAAVFAVLALVRQRIAQRLLDGAPNALWHNRIMCWFMASLWTAFAMFPVLHYGLAFPGLLAIICSLGLSAGGHVVFLIDRPLHSIFMIIMGSGIALGVTLSGNVESAAGI